LYTVNGLDSVLEGNAEQVGRNTGALRAKVDYRYLIDFYISYMIKWCFISCNLNIAPKIATVYVTKIIYKGFKDEIKR